MAIPRVLCFHVLAALILCLASSTQLGPTNRHPEHVLSERTSHPAKYIKPPGQVNVTMGMMLRNILAVRPKRGEVEMITWMSYHWNDPSLAWADLDEDKVHLPPSLIWTPDIVPYTATDPVVSLFPAEALVSRNGNVMYMPAQKMTNTCNVSKHRTGVMTCSLKMGSWTYDANKLNLDKRSDHIDISDYAETSSYTITSTNVTRNVKTYSCCPEPYIDITFDFTFQID